MDIPKSIRLGEDLNTSFRPGIFYDWKEYLLGIILLPFGVGVIILVMTELNRAATRYYLTTQRVIQESNFFSSKISVNYDLVKELHLHQTWLDKLFGRGSIIIETKRRKKSEIILKSIKDPIHTKILIEREISRAKKKKETLEGYM